MSGGDAKHDAVNTISAKLRSAATWSVLGQLALYSARFVSFFIVPHYLGPADYGVFGFALLFVTLFQLLIEAVITLAVVQTPRPVAEVVKVVAVGSMGVAAIGYGILCLLAEPATRLLGDSRVATLLPIMGAQLFMSAVSATRTGILQREMDFRKLFVVRVFGVLPSSAVTIYLAVTGRAYWALVVGWLCGGACQLIATLLLVSVPKSVPIERSKARELYGFCGWVAVDVTANWALEYGAGFFIGAALGAASLGTFRLADQIIRAVCAVALDPLSPVVYSAMTILRRDGKDVLASLPKLNHVFGTISIPLIGAFILIGGPVSMLLGPQWRGTAVVFWLDGIAWGVNYLLQAVPQLFRAVGRPGLVVLIRVPVLIVQTVVLVLAARAGMVAFLCGKIGVELLLVVLTAVVLRQVFAVPVRRLLGRHAPLMLVMPLCVAASYLAGMLASHAPVLVRLVVECLVFAVLSLLVSARDPDSYFSFLLELLRRKTTGVAHQ